MVAGECRLDRPFHDNLDHDTHTDRRMWHRHHHPHSLGPLLLCDKINVISVASGNSSGSRGMNAEKVVLEYTLVKSEVPVLRVEARTHSHPPLLPPRFVGLKARVMTVGSLSFLHCFYVHYRYSGVGCDKICLSRLDSSYFFDLQIACSVDDSFSIDFSAKVIPIDCSSLYFLISALTEVFWNVVL